MAKDEKMTSWVPLSQSFSWLWLLNCHAVSSWLTSKATESAEMKGAMATPLIERSVLSCVFSVLGLRCDWIKPWILDFRQTRRLTELFFYAAGLRSDYWSTTGTGNSPFWQLPAEERRRTKLSVHDLNLKILFSVSLRGLNSALAFKSWVTERMTKNLARNKYRNYLPLICLIIFLDVPGDIVGNKLNQVFAIHCVDQKINLF